MVLNLQYPFVYLINIK